MLQIILVHTYVYVRTFMYIISKISRPYLEYTYTKSFPVVYNANQRNKEKYVQLFTK